MTYEAVTYSNGYCFVVLSFEMVFTYHYMAMLTDTAKCLEAWRESCTQDKDKLVVSGIADYQNPIIAYSV